MNAEPIAAAVRVSALSVSWAASVGLAAAIAGLASGSLALFALGATAVLDGTASAILVWRFRHERRGTADVEFVERRAALIIGAIMLAVALYLFVRSVIGLTTESKPGATTIGIVLAAASAVVLPIFAYLKLRLARALKSAALRGDGFLSLAGGVLGAATMLSLIVNEAFGWWWADAVAALMIAAALAAQGRGTARDTWPGSQSLLQQ